MNGHAVRDRELLRAEYAAVVAAEREAHSAEFLQFLRGARVALEWVLGRTHVAPATAAEEPATTARMEREERYCDRIIYSPEPRPALDPDYANGVEHALAWSRGAEDELPISTAVPAATVGCTCEWRAA